MKYLIVLFLLHLLNINIPMLPNHIILPILDSALKGLFQPDRVKGTFSSDKDERRLFQIENQYQLYQIQAMKIGHRRTQSAHINAVSFEDTLNFMEGLQDEANNHNIIHLLQKSQFKTKQKVCSIEPLNAVPKHDEDKLFNFGKGLLKVELQAKQKQKKEDALRSIPEKLKHNSSKAKKTAETQTGGRMQTKKTYQSVLKINTKDIKAKAAAKEGSNQICRNRGEAKMRKLSVIEARTIAKSTKHRKDISNLK